VSFKPFKEIRVDPNAPVIAKDINAVQSNIASFAQQFINRDNLDKVLLKDIQLNAGLNKVSHGLGRNIQGWSIVRPRNGYFMGYEDTIANRSPKLLIYIHSATSLLCDIEVF
jgi:hypothetical protein